MKKPDAFESIASWDDVGCRESATIPAESDNVMPVDTGHARKLYEKYAPAMAFVSIKRRDETQGIGSAFHIGEGVFVTARHVVEDNEILEVAMTKDTFIPLEGEDAVGARIFMTRGGERLAVHEVSNGTLRISRGPFMHSDPDIDVAVFQVSEIDSRTPYARLGGHLDDWLGTDDFVLWEAIVLGYPPIPFTTTPYLVAATAQVNAQIDLRKPKRHVHFILSSMPRGGFSGGLAMLEGDFVLGVVTESLVVDNKDAELGFFSVLSVEPIFACLQEHNMLPACQTLGWDGILEEI